MELILQIKIIFSSRNPIFAHIREILGEFYFFLLLMDKFSRKRPRIDKIFTNFLSSKRVLGGILRKLWKILIILLKFCQFSVKIHWKWQKNWKFWKKCRNYRKKFFYWNLKKISFFVKIFFLFLLNFPSFLGGIFFDVLLMWDDRWGRLARSRDRNWRRMRPRNQDYRHMRPAQVKVGKKVRQRTRHFSTVNFNTLARWSVTL